MADTHTYTHTTTSSYGDNVGDSFSGIIFGFVLLAAGVCLLVWNEGNSFRQHSALKEGIRRVISIFSHGINPTLEGELVHIQGGQLRAADSASSTLKDVMFGVARAHTLKLKREVEMYQWVEHEETKEETRAGGEKVKTTTYNYTKEWRSSVVDSSSFKHSDQHRNPGEMRFSENVQVADPMFMDAFVLSQEVVDLVSWYESLKMKSDPQVNFDGIPNSALEHEAERLENGFYFGSDPPSIGDTRVTFRYIPEQNASIIAQQTGNTFKTYRAKHQGTILMLEQGEHDALEMFQVAQQRLQCQTMAIRLGGTLLLFVGFCCVFQFLATIFSFLPILSKVVGGMVVAVSFLLALVLGLVTIVLAWIVQRIKIMCCEGSDLETLYRQNQNRNNNMLLNQQPPQGAYNYGSTGGAHNNNQAGQYKYESIPQANAVAVPSAPSGAEKMESYPTVEARLV